MDSSRGNGNGVIRSSNNRSLSMSDTESQYQSPLRSESPLRSDDPDPAPAKPVADKFYSPNLSPFENHENQKKTKKKTKKNDFEAAPPSTLALYNNRVVREEAAVVKKKAVGGREGDLEDGVVGEEEEEEREGRRERGRRTDREVVLKRGELAFRVCEVALCLISFSVMAADKTQGWSGDSFDRYKEYRYCVAVTVIGFAYAAFQAFDLSYQLATGKYLFFHPLRCHFDFAMDQILAYLLISASSSAATRVDDWVLNWGKDEFTEMASASIGMSFLAFVAFSLSALISGYNLCNRSTS